MWDVTSRYSQQLQKRAGSVWLFKEVWENMRNGYLKQKFDGEEVVSEKVGSPQNNKQTYIISD